MSWAIFSGLGSPPNPDHTDPGPRKCALNLLPASLPASHRPDFSCFGLLPPSRGRLLLSTAARRVLSWWLQVPSPLLSLPLFQAPVASSPRLSLRAMAPLLSAQCPLSAPEGKAVTGQGRACPLLSAVPRAGPESKVLSMNKCTPTPTLEFLIKPSGVSQGEPWAVHLLCSSCCCSSQSLQRPGLSHSTWDNELLPPKTQS